MMKFFQKLGKSLMLPVACLPVCGILMGIGYILAPAAMAGEVQGFTAGGLSYSIGLFLIKAGGALIDNMSWLFAVGVGVGMADDSDGTAGLAGLVSIILICTGLVTFRYPSVICAGISFLTLAGLFIFRQKEMLREFHKKLRM